MVAETYTVTHPGTVVVHAHHALLADGAVMRARRFDFLALVAVAKLSQLVYVKPPTPTGSLDCSESVILWEFLLVSSQFFDVDTSHIRSLLGFLLLAWGLLHVWTVRLGCSSP